MEREKETMEKMKNMGLAPTNDAGGGSSSGESGVSSLQEESKWSTGSWRFWIGFVGLICISLLLMLKEPRRNEQKIVESQDSSVVASSHVGPAEMSPDFLEPTSVKLNQKGAGAYELATRSVSQAALSHKVHDADLERGSKVNAMMAKQVSIPRSPSTSSPNSFSGASKTIASTNGNAVSSDAKQPSLMFPLRVNIAGYPTNPRAEAQVSMDSILMSMRGEPNMIKERKLMRGYTAVPVMGRMQYPQRGFYPHYPMPGYPIYQPSYMYYPSPVR
uniref:Uncharacterized protein n=1 Tax=Candidatus Kentrum sp. MB TaxID=2138164 RepID=A0A450XVG8_9GAMM|nr:MAG: hypothetical protein BECKMB1821G_GA0114241_10415 [Candidatus Kentron sp. MB]VFK33279.1 MAG: hypothetical protein BECKMB1821I_GA0114274_10437 [Candidatus Kentron sp. MB]VFK76079.1 MAG: hypothetical protein BECKMB1821H_GA0114242_10417 [Candidatus Kentron sp. MB]